MARSTDRPAADRLGDRDGRAAASPWARLGGSRATGVDRATTGARVPTDLRPRRWQGLGRRTRTGTRRPVGAGRRPSGTVVAARRVGRSGPADGHGPRSSWSALLCVFGLVMVGSASPVISLGIYGSPWTIFIRQALWMGVGTGALLPLRPDRLPQVAQVRVPAGGGHHGPAGRRARARPRRHGRRIVPLDRVRHAPAPAVGADEAGPGRLRRRPR